MKTIELPGVRIEDFSGLYIELLKKKFDVASVGGDKEGTFIYLHDDEDKDPGPIAEAWVGLPSPTTIKPSVFEDRRREVTEMTGKLKAAREEKAKVCAAEEAARVAAYQASEAAAGGFPSSEGGPVPTLPAPEGQSVQVLPAPEQKESILKRIFRVVW